MTVTYEEVRDWVLALPGGREVEVPAWGHATLRYGDKMFASGKCGSDVMSVKATLEEQAELIAAEPGVYEKSAYTGRFGWVRVELAKVDRDELHDLVVDAWRRTAPKRVVKAWEAERAG